MKWMEVTKSMCKLNAKIVFPLLLTVLFDIVVALAHTIIAGTYKRSTLRFLKLNKVLTMFGQRWISKEKRGRKWEFWHLQAPKVKQDRWFWHVQFVILIRVTTMSKNTWEDNQEINYTLVTSLSPSRTVPQWNCAMHDEGLCSRIIISWTYTRNPEHQGSHVAVMGTHTQKAW